QIITTAARRWPNRQALVDERGRSYTFAQWNVRVNQLANGLASLGVTHGTRVAFYLRNVEAIATAHPATQNLGAGSVPLNFRLREGEIPVIVEDSDARVLLYERSFASRIEKARAALPSVERYICVDGAEQEDVIDYETLLSSAPSDEPVADVQQNDLGVL